MSSERPTSQEDAVARADTGHLNPSQLQSDIDHGATRDKVAHPDPAAAPLGTDSEAAGAPIDSKAAALERGGATNRGPIDTSVQHDHAAHGRSSTPSRLLIALLVVIAIGVIIAIWQMAG